MDLRETNLKALLPGYEKAIENQGFLRETYPGWYRIEQEYIKKILESGVLAGLDRIRLIEKEIEDVVARYLTHRHAGGSDRDLLIKEAISKVKRSVQHLREKRRLTTLQSAETFLIQSK